MVEPQFGNDFQTIAGAAFDNLWSAAGKQRLFAVLLQEFVTERVVVASANGWSERVSLKQAITSLAQELREASNLVPSWIIACCAEDTPQAEMLDMLAQEFPETQNVHGLTIIRGVTSNLGFRSAPSMDGSPRRALGLWAVFDPLGVYSTIGLHLSDEDTWEEAGFHVMDQCYMLLRKNALDCLKDTALDGKSPGCEPLAKNLTLFMSALPGHEEKVLDMVHAWSRSRFHRSIPVVGGTAADESIAGKWSTFGLQGDGRKAIYTTKQPGCVLTLMAASVSVYPLFVHPFTACNLQATVVSCGTDSTEGEQQGRVIHRLMDQHGSEHSAASLYTRWCSEEIRDDMFPDPDASPLEDLSADFMSTASLCPLAVQIGREGVDYEDYRIVLPMGMYRQPAGLGSSLQVLANVQAKASDVVLMRADKGDLLGRTMLLKKQLEEQMEKHHYDSSRRLDLGEHVAGAIFVWCGAAMLKIHDGNDGYRWMNRLSYLLSECSGFKPYIALHVFGEQGYLAMKQKSYQGNLMFSSLVFSLRACFEPASATGNHAHLINEIGELLDYFRSYCSDETANTLMTLLTHGSLDFIANDSISVGSFRKGLISPQLLQNLAQCACSPVSFSLRARAMLLEVLKSREIQRNPKDRAKFQDAAAWHSRFCEGVFSGSSLQEKMHLFDDESLTLAVGLIQSTGDEPIVLSQGFEEILQEIMARGGTAVDAMQRLMDPSSGTGQYWSPLRRMKANMIVFICMAACHVVVSHSARDSLYCWSALLVCHVSFLFKVLKEPSDLRCWTSTSCSTSLVLAFSIIVGCVAKGIAVPSDVDCVAVFLNAVLIIKFFESFEVYGPLIITIQAMVRDVAPLLLIFAFYACAAFFGLLALYNAGPTSHAASFNFVRKVLMMFPGYGFMEIDGDAGALNSSTMFFSMGLGINDAATLRYLSFFLKMLVMMFSTIVILNFLIAQMSVSFMRVSEKSDVEYKKAYARSVIAARELEAVPIPLSLPLDVWSVFTKIVAVRRSNANVSHEHYKPLQGEHEFTPRTLTFTQRIQEAATSKKKMQWSQRVVEKRINEWQKQQCGASVDPATENQLREVLARLDQVDAGSKVRDDAIRESLSQLAQSVEKNQNRSHPIHAC